jgi:hypothetical protein
MNNVKNSSCHNWDKWDLIYETHCFLALLSLYDAYYHFKVWLNTITSLAPVSWCKTETVAKLTYWTFCAHFKGLLHQNSPSKCNFLLISLTNGTLTSWSEHCLTRVSDPYASPHPAQHTGRHFRQNPDWENLRKETRETLGEIRKKYENAFIVSRRKVLWAAYLSVQRNLWNKDTFGTSWKCPLFRGVLISGCMSWTTVHAKYTSKRRKS